MFEDELQFNFNENDEILKSESIIENLLEDKLKDKEYDFDIERYINKYYKSVDNLETFYENDVIKDLLNDELLSENNNKK